MSPWKEKASDPSSGAPGLRQLVELNAESGPAYDKSHTLSDKLWRCSHKPWRDKLKQLGLSAF
jgi:hypothetical protein